MKRIVPPWSDLSMCVCMVHDLVLGFKDRNFSGRGVCSLGFVVQFFEGRIRFTNVVLKHFHETWFGVWAPFGILGSKFLGSD